jgi:hypothetical protein
MFHDQRGQAAQDQEHGQAAAAAMMAAVAMGRVFMRAVESVMVTAVPMGAAFVEGEGFADLHIQFCHVTSLQKSGVRCRMPHIITQSSKVNHTHQKIIILT